MVHEFSPEYYIRHIEVQVFHEDRAWYKNKYAKVLGSNASLRYGIRSHEIHLLK